MAVVVYERDRGFVLERLQRGEFDYIDSCDEVFEADFFRYIGARGILKDLAENFPTPRTKTEVPVWVALGSSLSMRLHGVEAFHQFEYVIRTGGFLNALGPEMGQKTVGEDGSVRLACPGYNKKNARPRDTPCDADFLRKFYRDTQSEPVHRWYNHDVARVWKKRHAFDAEGVFIGDATYLFVPDNPAYEHSVRMVFDEHNHPVDRDSLTAQQWRSGKYRWRRCYKLVTLLHVYPNNDCFLIVGLRVVPGKQSELPVFYELVDTFVEAVGDGVVKRLILDRGFLDGERIGHLKTDHAIDVLIPVRRNMDVYNDAMALIGEVAFRDMPPPPLLPPPPPAPEPEALRPPDAVPPHVARREAKRQKTLAERRAAHPPPPPAPDKQRVREEVGALPGFRSWSACPVPLSVTYSRETFADGHTKTWLLLDTAEATEPLAARTLYHRRTQTEERYRQLKCFTDLTAFTSRKFSLVLHQVFTVLLTYSLLQLYLVREEKKPELNRSPLPLMRRRMLPAVAYVVVYCAGKVAFFDSLTYTEIILNLDDEARAKARAKTRRLLRDRALLRPQDRPP